MPRKWVGTSATERRISLWVMTLQFLLVLSWTLYLIFLPPLLNAAGIDGRWMVWILVLDQAVFAVSDWAAGVFSDRYARLLRRIGPAITLMAGTSSLALLAMPWLAFLGGSVLMATIIVWAAGSAALRAPAFSLLARVGGVSTRSGVVSIALVGVCLGGAIGPLVTEMLQGVDPRLPLGCAALVLTMTALLASRVEARVEQLHEKKSSRPWALPMAVVMLIAAFGMQMQVTLGSEILAGQLPDTSANTLRTIFWLGFAVGLLGAARAARMPQALRAGTWALAVGTLAMVPSVLWTTYLLALGAQAVAGAAWAIVFTASLVTALSRGGPAAAGTPVGLLFSALACAALMRLTFVALGLSSNSVVEWIPVVAWALAAVWLARLVKNMDASA